MGKLPRAQGEGFVSQDQGPTVAGLCVVPALPFLFDHPVEYAVDKVFEQAEQFVLGKQESDSVRDAGDLKKNL